MPRRSSTATVGGDRCLASPSRGEAGQRARRLSGKLLLDRVRLGLGQVARFDLVDKGVGDGSLKGGVDLSLALADLDREVRHELAAGGGGRSRLRRRERG